MHDIQNWVLSGIICIAGTIVGFFSKTGFNLIVKLLSDIKEEIKKLISITETHEIKIENIKERLNDHEKRIRHLEFHQPKPTIENE